MEHNHEPIGFEAGALVPDPTFSVTAATVPEPGRLALLSVGLLAALHRRRR